MLVMYSSCTEGKLRAVVTSGTYFWQVSVFLDLKILLSPPGPCVCVVNNILPFLFHVFLTLYCLQAIRVASVSKILPHSDFVPK